MARLVWSRRAADDLASICAHIEIDSGHYASVVARRVIEAVESIALMPDLGSIVPEYDNRKVRERFVHKYRIIYRLSGETVEIAMIPHSSRLLPPRFPDSLN